MKSTMKKILALAAAAAMLLSLAACGGKSGGSGALMQALFDKLTTDAEYTEWKSYFPATTIEEKLEGDSIVITAKGEEGLNGTYTFTLDGDYIVTESGAEDYTGYSILMYLKSAIAAHYGMNNLLMTGYLAGLDFFKMENRYLLTEEADGKTVYKLYAAGKWDMTGLDEMFVNDAAVDGQEALGTESVSYYVNCGKISAAAFGNADALELIVGEYGENTENTYKSVMTLVSKLQPQGYETFAKDYTELKKAEGEGYKVSFDIPAEVLSGHDYKKEEGYSYVTVVFSSGDETADEAAPVETSALMDLAGSYMADRCSVSIEALSAAEADISAHWGQSASETYEFKMHGTFNAETNEITYSDGEKKFVAYDENGEVTEETVEYSGSTGVFRFGDDGTLTWEDDKEGERLNGMTFTRGE